MTIEPTGLMRSSTRCSSPDVSCGVLVRSCEIRPMMTIGTMNASATTMISCFGVLIGEECWSGSVMVAWEVGRNAIARGRARQNGQLYGDRCARLAVEALDRGKPL